MGYRGFDVRKIDPLFAFGFGLSYTSFALASASVDAEQISRGDHLTVRVQIENTGGRSGAEVGQVYANSLSPRARRAPRELVGFAKVALEPGERRTVEIVVDADDLAHWDARRGLRVLDDGTIDLHVGTLSRDLPLVVTVEAREEVPRWLPLERSTAPSAVLASPPAREAVAAFLSRKLDVAGDAAIELLEQSRLSFVNVFDTLANRFRFLLDEEEVAAVIEQVRIAERIG